MGASWAGKNGTKIDTPFPAGSAVGAWRDKTLSRPKATKSQSCGQDFFFVQDVRISYPF